MTFRIRVGAAALLLAAGGPAWAVDPCALLTGAEARQLLRADGPIAATPQPDGCVMSAGGDASGRLTLTFEVTPAAEATEHLKHLDEARGTETPSLGEAAWYELAPAPDGGHDMVVYRGRSRLIVDLRDDAQPDPDAALVAVYPAVAARLPLK